MVICLLIGIAITFAIIPWFIHYPWMDKIDEDMKKKVEDKEGVN